jgi:hypothetical protein
LKFEQAARRSSLRGVSVLTYAPGIEVEGRFSRDDARTRLEWIGFVGRHDLQNTMPTISAETLESLRIAGDPHGTLSQQARQRFDQERGPASEYAPPVESWLAVCLNASGEVTSSRPFEVSSSLAYDAFAAAITDWRFRPFVVAGHPVPACAYVRLTYPVIAPHEWFLEALPLSLFGPRDELVVERRGLGKRLAGTDDVLPTAEAKAAIDHLSTPRYHTLIRFCNDTSGQVASTSIVQSSGAPPWDDQLAALVRTWRFAPFVLHDRPTAICSYTSLYFASDNGSREAGI